MLALGVDAAGDDPESPLRSPRRAIARRARSAPTRAADASSCRRAATISPRSGARARDAGGTDGRDGRMPEPLDALDREGRARGHPAAAARPQPPPHWRLEAIAATERPRSPALVADGRTVVFIQDRDTSDVWLLDLAGRLPAPAHHRPRPAALLGGHRAGLLARRLQVAYADDGQVCLVPRREGRRGGSSRRAARSGSATTGSSSRSTATAATASPSSRVAEPWPQRLAREHGELDTHGDE